MKGSFVFPGYENEKDDSNSYAFDPQTDFSQFLEEAKWYASNDKNNTTVEKEHKEQVIINQEVIRSKKSWKTVLFPFWRSSSDKKSKQLCKETSKSAHKTNPKPRGHVSGPIYGSGNARAASSSRYWHRLQASGPLTGLFQHKKREENEIPYVSLEKLNKPCIDAKVYGPVYLVS